MAERDRIRPTPQARARLLEAVEVGTPACGVDAGTLGEYAAVLIASGQAVADAAFPETARHLKDGCPATCPDDLRELLALLREPEDVSEAGSPSAAPAGIDDSDVRPAELRDALIGEQDLSLVTDRPSPGADRPPPSPDRPGASERPRPADSAPSPAPTLPPAASLAPRRQLTLRDWLLIAAAAIVLLVGAALIGLAYLTSGRAGPSPSVPTVVPAFKPAPSVQSTAPPGQPTSPATQPAVPSAPASGSSPAGRAAPAGLTCPSTHPIKGNRESMIYHRPGDEFYDLTRPEDCFATAADAEAAGYRASRR